MKEFDHEEVVALARTLGEELDACGLTLATAESCTGGLIGHLITEIPGSSRYYYGGAIVYSYEAKETILGVDHDAIVDQGAVSFAVAEQMAHGARQKFDADIAVAVTGIAGPGGGLPDKPVGTVYIHVCATGDYDDGRRFVWDGDRSENKLYSAQAALLMGLDYVRQRKRQQAERSLNGQRSTCQ
jgi:PncC family amidohydrolase